MGGSSTAPGPGEYRPKEVVGKEGTSPSLHKKIEYKPVQKTGGFQPGPGAYESHVRNKKTAPSYGLGSSKRAFSLSRNALEVPGSTAYNPKMNLTQRTGQQWGFGSEKRKGVGQDKSNSPGPGNYKIEPMAFKKNPNFFLGEKIKEPKPVTDTPGAG